MWGWGYAQRGETRSLSLHFMGRGKDALQWLPTERGGVDHLAKHEIRRVGNIVLRVPPVLQGRWVDALAGRGVPDQREA